MWLAWGKTYHSFFDILAPRLNPTVVESSAEYIGGHLWKEEVNIHISCWTSMRQWYATNKIEHLTLFYTASPTNHQSWDPIFKFNLNHWGILYFLEVSSTGNLQNLWKKFLWIYRCDLFLWILWSWPHWIWLNCTAGCERKTSLGTILRSLTSLCVCIISLFSSFFFSELIWWRLTTKSSSL